MLVISKNQNNDIFLDNKGNISLSNDLQAVLQACETAVSAQLNEMIYAYNEGVPNFQTIWNGNPNFSQAEASIRATLLKVDNVLDIVSFSFTTANNIFSYNVVIETSFGIGELINEL